MGSRPDAPVVSGRCTPYAVGLRLVLTATLLGVAWLAGVDARGLAPLGIGLVVGYALPVALVRRAAQTSPTAMSVLMALDLTAALATAVLVPDLRSAVALVLLLPVITETLRTGRDRGLLVAAGAAFVVAVAEVVAESTPAAVAVAVVSVVAYVAAPPTITAITSSYHLAAGRLRRLTGALAAVEDHPDLATMLESVGELARSAVDGRYGAVSLVGDDRIRVDLESGVDDGTRATRDDGAELGGGPAIEAVRSGEVVMVTDAGTDPRTVRWSRWLQERGVGAVVALPLWVEGEVIGALSVGLADASTLEPGDVELLRSFGQAATLHILHGRSVLAADVARAELEEAARERSAFTAAVAHDLRAPLTTIKGFIDTVRTHQGRLDAVEIGRMLDVASRNADSLSRRIETLLQFTRLEAGRLTVELDEVELAPAVRVIVEDCAGELADHEVELAVDEVRVITDVVALSHVLGNLLGNAAKYSPPGSLITVAAHATGDEVRVEVRDLGPGVPAEDRERIFESFERGGGAAAPGTGLGLAIAGRYVELWGGDLGLAADATDGACFWFTVPLAERYADADGDGRVRTVRWTSPVEEHPSIAQDGPRRR